MNLKYYYWYFKRGYYLKSFCNDLIKYGNEKQEETALIGGYQIKADNNEELTNKEIKDLKKKRDSNIVWLRDHGYIKKFTLTLTRLIETLVGIFNGIGLKIVSLQNTNKISIMTGIVTLGMSPIQKIKILTTQVKIRKLSVTCSLSDPNDYEGGDLEFDFKQNAENENPQKRICSEIKEQGSIVIFPSFVWHRVKPVTKGTRNSLVIWNLGKPWV